MTIGEMRRTTARPPWAFLARRLFGAGFWGICDQALISASNFLTTVIIARTLSPGAFGAFTLAYAAIQVANSLQAALVTQPHNVLGAARRGDAYAHYTTATAVGQAGFTGINAIVAFGCAAVAWWLGWGITPLLVALACALIAWQWQEFVRRVLYTEERLGAACANDFVSYGVQTLGIFALAHWGRLTGASALYVVAATSAVAAVWGGWMIRGAFSGRALRPALLADGIRENWRFGKWLFGAAVSSWASEQVYPVLTGWLVSVAATGSLRAVTAIMGPTHILLRAMSLSLTPRAARLYAAGGYGALRTFIRRITLLTAPVMLVYCLLIALFARPILVAVYGDRYQQYGWLLALIALSYALVYLRTPAVIALEARGISAPVFQAYVWLTVVVLTLGVGAVHFLGLAGAAFGLVGNGVILNLVLWWWYHRKAETDMPVAHPPEQRVAITAPMEDRAIPFADISWAAWEDLGRQRYEGERVTAMMEQIPRKPLPGAAPPLRVGGGQSRGIPRWEQAFAILGLFFCLDAGVRFLRLVTGHLDPLSVLSDNGIGNYAEGDLLTQALLLGIYCVSAVLLLIRPMRPLRAVTRPKLLWCLLALATLSVAWSASPGVSLRRVIALGGSALFGVYLATRYSSRALPRLLLGVSVIALPLSVLVSLALPAYGIDPTGAWWGIFDHKNHLGQFMALSATLWFLQALGARRYRIVALGMGLASAVLVGLSQSASAIVLLVVLLAVLLVARLRWLNSVMALALLVVFLAGTGYLAVRWSSDPNVVFTLLGRDATLTGRTQLWDLVGEMIRARPWVGYGYGGFWLGYDGPSAAIWAQTGWNPPNAHNGFLDLMLDLGVAGALLFAGTLGINLRNALAVIRRGQTLDAAFPFIFLVFLVVSNLTESFLVTANTLPWVIYVALTIQLSVRATEHWQGRGRSFPSPGVRDDVAEIGSAAAGLFVPGGNRRG